jgi:hypothetical protein
MLATSVILTRAIFAGGELAAQQPRFWRGVTPLACDDLPEELLDKPPLESLRQRVKSLEVDGQAASAGDSDAGGDSDAKGDLRVAAMRRQRADRGRGLGLMRKVVRVVMGKTSRTMSGRWVTRRSPIASRPGM